MRLILHSMVLSVAKTIIRAYTSSSYLTEGSPIGSLSWWGWGSSYDSVVLGAPLKYIIKRLLICDYIVISTLFLSFCYYFTLPMDIIIN